MTRVNRILSIICFCLISNFFCLCQNDNEGPQGELGYLSAKLVLQVGINQTYCIPDQILLNEYYYQWHGSQFPSLYYKEGPAKLSPIFGLGLEFRTSKRFLYYWGLRYYNNLTTWNYHEIKYKPEGFPTSFQPYQKYETISTLDITQSFIQIDALNFAFVLNKTRVYLGIITPVIAIQSYKIRKVETNIYNGVYPNNAFNGYTYPNDSALVYDHTENDASVIQTPHLHSLVYLPFSIGLEQQVPLKRGSILISIKALSNFRGYYAANKFYTGYQLNLGYSFGQD